MSDTPPRPTRPPLQPFAVAVLLGVVYVVLCGGFVFISGQLAFDQADTLEHLQQIEITRGVAFVLVTGILFFVFTLILPGTGLGLLSVKACAEEHNGRVEALPSPLGGACFRMTLPLRSALAPPPSFTFSQRA